MMSESKSRSNFPLWKSLGMAKMQSQIFHTHVPIGPHCSHTLGPDSLGMDSSSASDNAFFPTVPFLVTRHLSSNPGNTISCISFESLFSDYTYLSEDHLCTDLVPFTVNKK
jgi:hypothetical protein